MNTRKSFGKARHYLMILLILAMTVGSVPIQAQDDDGSSTEIFLPIVQRAGDDTNNQEGGNVQAAIYNGDDISGDVAWLVRGKAYFSGYPFSSFNWFTGSLVHPEWILTSQHQFYHEDDGVRVLNTGDVELAIGWVNASIPQAITVSMDDVILFPGFTYLDPDTDLALIHLPSSINAEIPTLDGDSVSLDKGNPLMGMAYGWGSIALNTNTAIPQEAEFQIDNPDSTNTYGHTHVFSDSVDSGITVCVGDSGGPLSHELNEQVVLFGVNEAVDGYTPETGCQNTTYQLWTRVSDFIEWIKYQISREAGETVAVSYDFQNFGNNTSVQPAVSADGGDIAFASLATNFTTGNTNGKYQVYTGGLNHTPVLVSRNNNGSPGNHNSTSPSISGNGRYIAFASDASDLLSTGMDTNSARDIFLYDDQTLVITRTSVTNDEAQANGASTMPDISVDGNRIVFVSSAINLDSSITDSNNTTDIYVRDIAAGTTRLVSINTARTASANGISTRPSISADGRYVAFESSASNLVSGDTNGKTDIFIRDLDSNAAVTRVSVSTPGTQANDGSLQPAISENGTFVVFQSASNNLVTGDTNGVVDVFLRDTIQNTTVRISNKSSGSQSNGASSFASISDDGRYITFKSEAKLTPDDVNGGVGASFADVYVYDRVTAIISLTSVDSDEAGGNALAATEVGSMSGDGCSVAFVTNATNLHQSDNNNKSDIYVRTFTCGKPLSEVP